MATQRALQSLEALVQLNTRVKAKARILAADFASVIAEMDAIVDDADVTWNGEVLAEETTGEEVTFTLLHTPVKASSLAMFVDGMETTAYSVDLDTGLITPSGPVPAGKRITASYLQLGLKSQMTEILATLPSLGLAQFAEDKSLYQTAIGWIKDHFPI